MKKSLTTFFILILGFLVSNAQDTATAFVKSYNQTIIENAQLKEEKQKLEKQLGDSINELKKIRKKLNKCKDYEQINEQKDSLQKEINKLTGKQGKIEKMHDTIADQKTTIETLQNQLGKKDEECKNQLDGKEKSWEIIMDKEKVQAKALGKQEIQDKIEAEYNKDFETLIRTSTLQTVQRDLNLVQNANVKKTLQQLESYFLIKESLNQKFDERTNNQYRDQVGLLPQNAASVSKLKKSVEKYSFKAQKLQECLKSLIEFDGKTSVEDMDKESQQMKRDKIMQHLTRYIQDTEFDETQYPYLSKIFFEVMRRKQINADKSIQDLYQQLK